MASIYVTAFGPFAGVEVNPTEELLADLQARWKSQPLGRLVKGFGEAWNGDGVLGSTVRGSANQFR